MQHHNAFGLILRPVGALQLSKLNSFPAFVTVKEENDDSNLKAEPRIYFSVWPKPSYWFRKPKPRLNFGFSIWAVTFLLSFPYFSYSQRRKWWLGPRGWAWNPTEKETAQVPHHFYRLPTRWTGKVLWKNSISWHIYSWRTGTANET